MVIDAEKSDMNAYIELRIIRYIRTIGLFCTAKANHIREISNQNSAKYFKRTDLSRFSLLFLHQGTTVLPKSTWAGQIGPRGLGVV